MKRILILFFLLFGFGYAGAQNMRVAANAPEIEYVGRTQVADDGAVSFDWSGTYLYCRFTGGCLAMRVSDTKKNYYNLFIDGELQPRVITTFGADSLIVVAEGLPEGEHLVCLQKRTEGEQGRTTIHSFELARKGCLLPAGALKERLIEYIGDSLTCGFGTEGKDKNEPFLPETENCNLAYGCILARYFEADYRIVAHSGRGMVRNYGDSLPVSERGTLNHRIDNTFDEDSTVIWDYTASRKPDVVVINLGSNDFSTRPNPTQEQFTAGYARMVNRLREVYGDVPVVCVSPRPESDLLDYIREFVRASGDKNLYMAAFLPGYCNDSTEQGSCGHPNYEGQRKMAMTLAPYISTAAGWHAPHTTIE